MIRLPDADPLLTLAVVLVAGVGFGALAKLARLPSITGQILAGVLIGPALGVFDEESVSGVEPFTHFALGLMAVTVGAHLNLKRMRNAAKRLTILVLSEATIIPALVGVSLVTLGGMSWSTALLLGAIAVSTAPATIVTLVKETRSRGVFVKTLVGAVALNNMACIFLFELAHHLARGTLQLDGDGGTAAILLGPLRQFLLAILIGWAGAVAMQMVNRFAVRPEVMSTAGVLAILMTSGLSNYLDVSPLLSCLFLGMVQTNLTPAREEQIGALFKNFEPAILAVFFTLAGMHLNFGHARTSGLIAIIYFAARLAGKLGSVELAMWIAGATPKVRRFLGVALVPQAGLAIGLVLLLQEDPIFREHPEVLQLILAVVLTVVTANEIVGPVLTRFALGRSGEIGRDRGRLLDFIQEENILTDFTASTKEEAIEKLVDHMIRSHHMDVDRQTLLDTVLEREAQASTCLGSGLAVPHAILPNEHAMVGVLGISREGLDIHTPDGRPVRCMALLGTSIGERNRHLQVLATLASAFGTDPAVRDRLFNATSPAHAAEVLHGEDSEGFNYFLDSR